MARRRRETRAEVRGHSGGFFTGPSAELFSQAMERWADSGFDRRLVPYAFPDADTQRNYDLYDAWVNTGYAEPSPYWPPRTRRGRLLPGFDVDDNPAVSIEGMEGYEPDPRRIEVWGLGGELATELEQRGTLGTRRRVRRARPDPAPAGSASSQ